MNVDWPVIQRYDIELCSCGHIHVKFVTDKPVAEMVVSPEDCYEMAQDLLRAYDAATQR